MSNTKRPRTPMWKAGVKPKSKRYDKGGQLKTNGKRTSKVKSA